MGVLAAVTVVATYQYYKHIRMAHHEYEKANMEYEKANKEYEKAKDFLEDIVLSFDRELKRESAKFDTMVSKVEGSYTTADVSYRKAETIERKIEPMETQLDVLTQSYNTISQEITDSQTESMQHNSNVLSGLSGLEVKLKDIDTTQGTLRSKILDLEEQIKKLATAPATHTQIASEIMLPPIPIKRDKALAALTDTEIQVLEMLSKEGSKTAPEIKERVQLSREHTARLMKKLYEDGYLEREAGKLPFRYSIKKEMEALLQKVENPAI